MKFHILCFSEPYTQKSLNYNSILIILKPESNLILKNQVFKLFNCNSKTRHKSATFKMELSLQNDQQKPQHKLGMDSNCPHNNLVLDASSAIMHLSNSKHAEQKDRLISFSVGSLRILHAVLSNPVHTVKTMWLKLPYV